MIQFRRLRAICKSQLAVVPGGGQWYRAFLWDSKAKVEITKAKAEIAQAKAEKLKY